MYTFKTRLLSAFLLACLSAVSLGSHAHAGLTKIYVDQDAAGLNNGTSWEDAYVDLQSALAAAVSGDEIYVAEGIYKPTTGSDRTATFQLEDGVDLYGGFDGVELYVTHRDLLTHVTILSGDIGIPGDSSDNSYHVVTANTSGGARLDGFTVTGGNADGIEVDQVGSGLVRRGGVGNTLILEHVIFRNNSAYTKGGGAYNEDGGLSLDQVAFEDNTAGQFGGGVYNSGTVMLTSTTFRGNSASGGGGLYSNSQAVIANSTFYDNHATSLDGGAIFSNTFLIVLFSTFSDNSAAEEGAAIYNTSGEMRLNNSILANSTSGVDCYNNGGILSTDHNLIENNASGANACGTPILTADPDLGPLQNNGRFTDTMALNAGSPALQAADDTACPDTDQRRMARPQGVHCDLGAFELAETPPGAATLDWPSGTLDPDTLIYFRWNEVDNATWYYLWIEKPSGIVLKRWYTADQADCDLAGCSIVPAGIIWSGGTYTWWVQTRNEAGTGPWSAPMTFEVTAPSLPGKATLIAPMGRALTTTPTYRWTEVPDATRYYLLVTTASGVTVVKGRYETSAVCSDGVCAITPATRLTTGTSYTWQVQTWNKAGYGPWSDPMGFRVTGFR
jgi:predicted outer membrane repeat protein